MAENTAAPAPAKKGKLKLIIMLVVIIVLAVALSIVGTLWFLGGGLPGGGEGERASTSEPAFVASSYIDLERPLVTTVQAQGRQRYAQVHLSLEASDPVALAAAETHMPLIRSQLVMVLGNSEFNELQTPEGRSALAEQLLTTVNQVLEEEGEPSIKRVLFRNFVVQ
ncbi:MULTISPECIES: flagellar basal body-associated protein FliL [unclassified Marinobacter]|uniref:flagellar basal body-associated FliL family protein n=1 Tax=unclassified Marinobacter TaxID=83889 RepID=UPI000718EBD9|nr:MULTISPECIES: flagellar basal body-associated FliL family protein [unclassified Marinobacter]MDX5441125.1 flagellar basal body-associated FliL family protein [Alteromonadaceae bacterium]AMQ90583.1 flagellar basal body protein FliL [Marinobacter sp. LQ44]MDX5328919.1 flagellar basal body-associated FliL family protein [Marinobacter sp.]MDX5336755.1 flagellar basal body-associated FliL family protein [Marinobacter sp.]MDX5387913.1 flagellar basal body-associated FliL family protein [Marinobac